MKNILNKDLSIQEKDILLFLNKHKYSNQRNISRNTKHSLGIVNHSLKTLLEEEYVDHQYRLTEKAYGFIEEYRPQNAIILAAGQGIYNPILDETVPKGMLEINGEVIIERLILQLHAVDIKEIYIVVGFAKEKFEYLIDKYNVKLVISTEYMHKNNLHSLKLVKEQLKNTYIIPADLYIENNVFRKEEAYSWYMISDKNDDFSSIRVNKKMELVETKQGEMFANHMVGIGYLTKVTSDILKKRMEQLCKEKRYNGSYWEESLYSNGKMIVYAKMISNEQVKEIDSYEQYCSINGFITHKVNDAVEMISKYLKISKSDIKLGSLLKKGVTNYTYEIICDENPYVLRIPMVDRKDLIDRNSEQNVYQILKKYDIGEELLFFDNKTGIKLSKKINYKRICKLNNKEDLKKCIKALKNIHEIHIEDGVYKDLFEEIERYENLWKNKKSVYIDYEITKKNIYSLKKYVAVKDENLCLIHMDPTEGNFLCIDQNEKEDVCLIDWEYSCKQDPRVDIALFAIQALYNKDEVDELINIYYDDHCSLDDRYKIYSYIAICGLMWSNWCEFERQNGIDFGEYSIRQYRYAKNYYKIVSDNIKSFNL